jgi:hypothetical protein
MFARSSSRVGQSFEREERGAEAPLGARTAREQPACPVVLPLRRKLMLKKLIVSTLVTGALSLGAAVPAAAQPTVQRGLVNINVGDVTVQAPIAIAANICDVTVAVLVSDLRDGSAACDAFAESDATVTPAPPGGGPVVQEGLVNVNIGDVTIQVPIAVAANLCDVTVAALATDLFLDGEATCDAVAGAGASG